MARSDPTHSAGPALSLSHTQPRHLHSQPTPDLITCTPSHTYAISHLISCPRRFSRDIFSILLPPTLGFPLLTCISLSRRLYFLLPAIRSLNLSRSRSCSCSLSAVVRPVREAGSWSRVQRRRVPHGTGRRPPRPRFITGGRWCITPGLAPHPAPRTVTGTLGRTAAAAAAVATAETWRTGALPDRRLAEQGTRRHSARAWRRAGGRGGEVVMAQANYLSRF